MIIANSSPLVALGRIDRLDILEAQFGKIDIPDAVYRETVIQTSYNDQRAAILLYSRRFRRRQFVLLKQEKRIHSVENCMLASEAF